MDAQKNGMVPNDINTEDYEGICNASQPLSTKYRVSMGALNLLFTVIYFKSNQLFVIVLMAKKTRSH